MNKKTIIGAVCAAMVCTGVWAAPHGGGRGPAPRGGGRGPAPMHQRAPRGGGHHGKHHKAHQAFLGGIVGGVVGGIIHDAVIGPCHPEPAPVVVHSPPVVVHSAPVVVQPAPVVEVQRVWVPGQYVNQIAADGTVVRVWHPGHWEERTVSW